MNGYMSGDLLQTKLYVPRLRPSLVPRPHLIEKLNRGVQQGCKLTLVSAPAGFGKTTLIAEWATGMRRVEPKAIPLFCWLSLDEGDNDPTRFLTYFVAALQTLTLNEANGDAPTIGEGVLAALQSPQPPPIESILTTLLNDVTAVGNNFVLVLDDYHLIDAQAVGNAVTFLLEHLPPQMHLVIVTRDDPHLPLARLRARGQLTELRVADLRFSLSEAAGFLNQVMGLNLSMDDVAALETRTEGWIAGLQLAAVSMQGHQDTTSLIKSFTGSHRFVLDYLIEEVLNQQSATVQTFLLETAVLDRMCGPLCDAILSKGVEEQGSKEDISLAPFPPSTSASSHASPSAQDILEYLEQANLFIIPLDQERRWYRYHHLFADLLHQHLRQSQPERLPILHHKASEWYEQTGFVDEAIEHAMRGEHFERAAYLIEDQYGVDYERGDQTMLRRWLVELPEELVSSKPPLCILYAWILFNSGQLDEVEHNLQIAEKMLGSIKDLRPDSSQEKARLSEIYRRKLIGRIAIIRSFLASYIENTSKIIQYAQQALEYLPEQELEWRSAAFIALGDAYASEGQMAAAHQARLDALATSKLSGNIYILMIVNLRLAEVLREQGKLQQVVDTCEHLLKRANESGILESALVGWLFGLWSEVLAELNHLDEAIELAKKGVKLTTLGKDVFHIASSNLCMVRVLFSCGDITGAEDVIQSLQNTAREYNLTLKVILELSAWQGRIWLAQDKLELASQWVAERELDPEREPTYLHETEYIVFARILMAQGRLNEATLLLQRLLKAAEDGGRTTRVIEILLLQALAAQSTDETPRALSTLGQALTLAEIGGYIHIFVDEGPRMARLLYEALSRGISPDYVRQLLAAFPVTEPKQATLSQKETTKHELIEPLSEREIEVLQLIAEGLTNPEIAARLYLSPNTIKVHTHNIYGKLGVKNRTQAVTKARAVGFLSTD